MKPKAIIVSGYFNPLHKGHLELFEKAKAAGDQLWVIVNSDLQRELKGSKEFMDENERLIIVSAIKYVDKALISRDQDKTQCATLAYLADEYGANFELCFANGGDQNNESIPEVSVCKENEIGLIEGLGDKIQSSSWLLKKKIVIVSNGNIPSQYANSINTMRHAEAFRQLGNEVLICSVIRLREQFNLNKTDISSHYNISSIPIKFFRDNTLFYLNTSYFNLIHALINKSNFFKRIFCKSLAEKRISEFIRNSKYDFAYCRSYFVTIYNLRLGIPTIIETHAPNPNKIKELLILKNENLEFLLGIVTIHKKIKIKLIKMGFPKDKIVVLEDAVQENFFNKRSLSITQIKRNLKIPKNKKIITYVGSLKRGKGIEKIIEISKALKNTDSIIFNIVGGSTDEINLVIKKCSPNNNVNFFGFQNGKDIPDFFAISDLLLLLYDIKESKPVMDYSTTSPIKLFEYMSSGKPILASKLDTIEKIVDYRDDILIYEQKDVSNQILEIINNPNKYELYGQNSKNFAKKFTYKNRVKYMIECFIK